MIYQRKNSKQTLQEMFNELRKIKHEKNENIKKIKT